MQEFMLTYDDPMFRIVEIRRSASAGSDRVRGAWQAAARQPSWIGRFALTVFFFIIMLPIFALLLLAFLAAIVVFIVLAVANTVIGAIRAILPRRADGRENVRIIHRRDAGS